MLTSATLNTGIDPILGTPDPEIIIDPVESGGSVFEGTKLDNFLDRVEDKAVGIVDSVTNVQKTADKFTDYLINKARSLQNRSTVAAETNLTKAKAGSYLNKLSSWAIDNKAIAAGIGVLIFILIWKR